MVLDDILKFSDDVQAKFDARKISDYKTNYGQLEVFINNAGMVETDETRAQYAKLK